MRMLPSSPIAEFDDFEKIIEANQKVGIDRRQMASPSTAEIMSSLNEKLRSTW